jgi:hypothetical protein
LLFSKHFDLQSGGRLAGVKREIKTETTGSFTYNFSALKKVPEEPNFSVNRTALTQYLHGLTEFFVALKIKIYNHGDFLTQ